MNLLSKLLLTVYFLFVSLFAQAQTGKLFGKVLNEKNEPIIGVSVTISENGGTNTDIEGRFSLNLVFSKKYTIEFSAVGYSTKIVSDIEIIEKQINELNIILEVKAKTEEVVTVTASPSSARRETVNAIIAFQKNTNTIASVISAETIRRSPDRNTADVLKRTSGVSIQEGKFIIVRGLTDRYNQAMLNGVLLTSTEPDRKTFSFDLIPAALIDNIIINKAFVPEYPGEWAGGMIQVNTKDIPQKGFFNIQLGTSVNSQTTGKDFYKEAQGGKLDWLGIEDGTRGLPDAYTTKSNFDTASAMSKTAIGKKLRNSWIPIISSAPINVSFQANAGFNTALGRKKIGGTFGIIYNKTNKHLQLLNRSNTLNAGSFSVNYNFADQKYVEDILVGALGSLAIQFNTSNKISVKSFVNNNSSNVVVQREGVDFNRGDQLKGSEFYFKQNTFFTNQIIGEHNIAASLKLKWYGAFTILDSYIPDQRRILYSTNTGSSNPYRLIISNSLSQQSGSRIFQNLSDYIYTAGGDFNYSFNLWKQKQSMKVGYMLQIKDRLYDGKFFANYLQVDNDALRQSTADQIFSVTNFGNGNDNKFGFDAIKNRNFRYLANTILNAGFVQFDNQFSSALRTVWGLRVESYDQLVGSVKTWDPRHIYSKVIDLMPGVNMTYKVNSKTNLRFSASQTIIRPELRELSALNIFDFELNASVQGYPELKRIKISNFDLRYELYPRAGEMFTIGGFYKHFKSPIEQIFDEVAGGASTFTYRNPEKAIAYGAEMEFRKKMDFINVLKNFTIQFNGSYIYSLVKDSLLDVNRPMQGQSPYVLNAGLFYDLEKADITATLLFNQIGRRIYVVGLNALAIGGSPNIYEAPRAMLDFQLSKKFMDKKAEFKFTISDLLSSTQYFYQNADEKISFEKAKDAYRFTRKSGTTIGISLNYSL